MSTIETGGPAFPMQEPQAIHAFAIAAVDGITDSEERDRAYLKARAEAVGGATLRDYFAAKAMQAMISKHGREDDNPGFFDFATDESVARCAYIYADAMLAARKPDPQQ